MNKIELDMVIPMIKCRASKISQEREFVYKMN
jgi:uncharacterized FlgJ-related protein